MGLSSLNYLCVLQPVIYLKQNITNGKLSVKTNGEIWITDGQTPSTLVKRLHCNYNFWDKEDDKKWSIGTKY